MRKAKSADSYSHRRLLLEHNLPGLFRPNPRQLQELIKRHRHLDLRVGLRHVHAFLGVARDGREFEAERSNGRRDLFLHFARDFIAQQGDLEALGVEHAVEGRRVDVTLGCRSFGLGFWGVG